MGKNEPGVLVREAVICGEPVDLPVALEQDRMPCLAQPRGGLDEGIEHRLDIKLYRLMTWSTSEVAICCSRDSLSSSVRACTSSNSRTFSIAMTAWSAKVVTRSICFGLYGPGTIFATKITPTTLPSRRSGTPSAAR